MQRDFDDVQAPLAAVRNRPRRTVALVPGKVRPPTLLSMPAYLAGNVGRIGARLFLRVLKEQGLHLSHHAVLATLRDFGPLAQHELADRLDVDRSQVVGFVDRLQRDGYVTRSQDAGDRRRVLVSLTAAGRTIERQMTAAAHQSQASLLSALSPSEQAELLRLLQRVLDAHDEARLDFTER